MLCSSESDSIDIYDRIIDEPAETQNPYYLLAWLQTRRMGENKNEILKGQKKRKKQA